MSRVYLDWNATAPLRPEARAAMIAAMDVVGNPSSVHAEGRAAKAIVEKARGQVAALADADASNMILTSGASESLALASHYYRDHFLAADIEHDCVIANRTERLGTVGSDGALKLPMSQISSGTSVRTALCFQAASSETGVIQFFEEISRELEGYKAGAFCDAVQAFGKIQFAFNSTGFEMAAISAHKLGGPKGVGALMVKSGIEVEAVIIGGGQEKGRRSGTENVIGIAGMGAAAEAAQRDLDNGVWDQVAQLRDDFEDRILNAVNDVTIFGKDVARLPNTSYFAVPGWKGETQVMQMDLAGYAVSAGSACSSGKVKASRVLKAMGFDDLTASSALRVSIGPTTTKAELDGFATAWLTEYRRFKARAA